MSRGLIREAEGFVRFQHQFCESSRLKVRRGSRLRSAADTFKDTVSYHRAEMQELKCAKDCDL